MKKSQNPVDTIMALLEVDIQICQPERGCFPKSLPEGKQTVKGWRIWMSTSNMGYNYFIIFFKTREWYTSCIQYFICDPMVNNDWPHFFYPCNAMGNNPIFLEQKHHLNNFLTLAYPFQIISLMAESWEGKNNRVITLDPHISFVVTRRYGDISLVREKWWTVRIMITTNNTYPLSFVTQIICNG